MKKMTNEELFLSTITSLIDVLLINNKNYDNHFYTLNGESPLDNVRALMRDTKERAEIVIGTMQGMKHLINVKDNS
ncbi:MAG: hypothetical protein GTO02_15870 [Candidatus Dadabacteria bacterium]|nr:hypothetical protein [Candidatus Dadabacteria bacterium]